MKNTYENNLLSILLSRVNTLSSRIIVLFHSCCNEPHHLYLHSEVLFRISRSNEIITLLSHNVSQSHESVIVALSSPTGTHKDPGQAIKARAHDETHVAGNGEAKVRKAQPSRCNFTATRRRVISSEFRRRETKPAERIYCARAFAWEEGLCPWCPGIAAALGISLRAYTPSWTLCHFPSLRCGAREETVLLLSLLS